MNFRNDPLKLKDIFTTFKVWTKVWETWTDKAKTGPLLGRDKNYLHQTLPEMLLLWYIYCLEATWTFTNHSNSSTGRDDWQQDSHGTCTLTHLSKVSIFISHSILQTHSYLYNFVFSKQNQLQLILDYHRLSWPEYCRHLFLLQFIYKWWSSIASGEISRNIQRGNLYGN